MPSNKMMFAKTVKRAIDKDNYKPGQAFCCDCNQPINQNCHTSDIMNGKCGRCYRMNVREHTRRSMNKIRDNKRNNQRKFKCVSQQY